MKKYNNINGWTVSLYTDEGQDNNRSAGYKYLSWSPYDRIQINITDKFKEFIFPSDKGNWCGVKQQLHLIPYYYIISGQEEIDTAEWKCSYNDHLVKRNDLTDYYGLQCIVTVRLNYDLLAEIVQDNSNSEKQSILKQVTNHLSQYGKKHKNKFDCISFTTLGSEDFAFMFFANDIETFSDLLHILREQTIEYKNIIEKGKTNKSDKDLLFSNICSIVGFNKSDYTYKPTLKAVVKINAKSIETTNVIIRKIKEISDDEPQLFDMLQGINVFEIRFSPKDLTLWHKPIEDNEKNILNGESNFYKENINSSRTFWQSRMIDALSEDYKNIKVDVSHCNKRAKEDKNKVNEKQKKNNNPIFGFILNEYDRMYQLSRCVEWKGILDEQRKCLKAFDSYYYDTDNEKRELADGMQAILTHINQACTPIYEVPYHNHFYAGSFDDILKMYYGIVKCMIHKGNSIKRIPVYEPSSFSFGIRFDSVENIQTTCFATDNQKDRFVVFQLPYSALYDFETIAELLVHEVFHYIAPINRKLRNKQLLNIWMEYLINKINEFIKFINHNSNSTEEETIEKILEIDFEKLLNDYNSEMLKSYEDFEKYELSIFTMLEFAEDACTRFCSMISQKLYEKDEKKWNDLTKKANKLSLHKAPDNPDAMDLLILWLSSKDVFKGMVELVSAVKEIFCDLFMCAIYRLDFEQYLALLKRYKRKQRVVIANDDMALPYRLMIIVSILRSEYKIEDISFNLTAKERQQIENKLTDTGNENFHTESSYISKLIRNINRIGTSSSMCCAIVKTIEEEINYIRNNPNDFSELNNKSLKCLLSTNDKADFTGQVEMMNCFINYKKSTIEEKEDSEDDVPHYSISCSKERYYDASSMSEYIDAMINISRQSSGQLWYRGVCNCNFSLIPSLLREEFTNLSLYAMQANYLKCAYSATISYPDLWKGKIQEHISLLQHYGMPTNLLDFSLDMLTALHFAVNPDGKDDIKRLDDGVCTPVVYAFDPNEYVNAVVALREERILESQYNVSPILYEVADDEMSDFFPKAMDAEFLISHSIEYTKFYKPCNRTDRFPIPLIVRHSHDRIRVQGGTFVAFSLNSRPDINEKVPPYSYLDLKKIELEYEKLQNNKEERTVKKFLYGIRILPSAIKSIQDDIKELKITKSSVYPELNHIFEEARKNPQNHKKD